MGGVVLVLVVVGGGGRCLQPLQPGTGRAAVEPALSVQDAHLECVGLQPGGQMLRRAAAWRTDNTWCVGLQAGVHMVAAWSAWGCSLECKRLEAGVRRAAGCRHA